MRIIWYDWHFECRHSKLFCERIHVWIYRKHWFRPKTIRTAERKDARKYQNAWSCNAKIVTSKNVISGKMKVALNAVHTHCCDSWIEACAYVSQHLVYRHFCFDYFVSDVSRVCYLYWTESQRHRLRCIQRVWVCCEWWKETKKKKKEIREKRKRGKNKIILSKQVIISISRTADCWCWGGTVNRTKERKQVLAHTKRMAMSVCISCESIAILWHKPWDSYFLFVSR